MKWLMLFLALIFATPAFVAPAFVAQAYALVPGEALEDPVQETRARALMVELRCLVCQNETIEASPSPFAGEVRVLLREQIAAGRTDAEIKSYLTARYGDAILFRPRMGPATWVLWLGPFLLLAIGAIITGGFIRSARGVKPQAPLSDAEQARLDEILGSDDDRQA